LRPAEPALERQNTQRLALLYEESRSTSREYNHRDCVIGKFIRCEQEKESA
jgi:hypothetical protein